MLSDVALTLARPRIDFLFAPGDRFTLLCDNPAASAPSYDLVLLADAIRLLPARRAELASVAQAVAVGRATPPYGFWAAVIVAAALVLFALSRALGPSSPES